MNELIRNRTPPIRIRVESQEIDEENSEFLLNFVFVSAFSFAPSMGKKQARTRTIPIIPRRVYNLIEE